MIIHALAFHQCIMGPFFHNTLFRQHKDPVRIADRGKPVGDGKGRSSLRKLRQGLRNLKLTLIIQRGSRLVQNDDRRIFFLFSCNADTLLLPAGKFHAPLSHIGIVTVLQPHNKLMGSGAFRRFHHFLFGRPLSAVTDIIKNRTRKQIDILLYDTDTLSEAL